jgi:hypothetical protein
MCQLHRELHRRGDVTGGLFYRKPPKATPMGTVLDSYGRPVASPGLPGHREPFDVPQPIAVPPLATYGYDNGNFSGYPLAVDAATDDDVAGLDESSLTDAKPDDAGDDGVAYSDAEAASPPEASLGAAPEN